MSVDSPNHERALSIAMAGLERGRAAGGGPAAGAGAAWIERLDETTAGVVRPTWRCFSGRPQE
ncbi:MULTISPECIES: hypothetical protein [unclassified Streptomyces]|uniref:hypothetical protein n=1 Tax=unclassified Streptomyces TaxID=2593676 RepID=UPI00236199E8|nr:hypothetical protein [Streptomyces sp. MMBL 11-1]